MAEIHLLQTTGCNVAKHRKCQEEPAETGRSLRLLVANMLGKHDLRLILKIFHLDWILIENTRNDSSINSILNISKRIYRLVTYFESTSFRLEKNDGFEASKLGRVDDDNAEARYQLPEKAQISVNLLRSLVVCSSVISAAVAASQSHHVRLVEMGH